MAINIDRSASRIFSLVMEMSEYELIREANIKRNNEKLFSLFGSEPGSISRIKRRREPNLKSADTQAEGSRKSSRISDAMADRTRLEEAERKYSIDSSGIMTCNTCNDIVQTKSSKTKCTNYDYAWRSHQSNCSNKHRENKINNLHECRDINFRRSSESVDHTVFENFEDCLNNDEDEYETDVMLEEKSDPVRKSNILEEYQSRIGNLYDFNGSDFPFRVRGGRQRSWQQYALIHEYVVNKNLSIRDGDDLIDLIELLSTVQSSHPGHCERQLPKNYITIHQANEKANLKIRELKTVEIPLPVGYFGNFNLRKKALRPFVGVHFNILERIAETLLFCDPGHFRTAYEPLTNRDGDRVYSNFESGECFSKLCGYTKDKYGELVVPICIGIGLDATQINSNKSRSATPVSFVIYNLAGDSERSSFHCEFVGYAPTDFPESVRELNQILLNRGCKVKEKRNKIISIARRKAVQDYLFEVLKPIVDSQGGDGLTIQVGSSDKAFKIRAIPYVVSFLGDNEGSNHLLGISSSRKFYRCRICEDKDCSSCSVPPAGLNAENHVLVLRPRKDEKYDRLSRDNDHSSQRFLMGSKKHLNDEEFSLLEQCFTFNITPGVNKLYDVVKLTSDARICGLHEMAPPDHMHTFDKGPKETVMAYAMKVLYSIGDLDSRFASSVPALDRLIIDFDINVSLPYVKKMVGFGTGISAYFPRKMLKSDRSTGLMTGGVPTWKLSSMIVQMQLCIGFEAGTSLLPHSKHWCRDLIYKRSSVRFSKEWCIAEIVHNALSSTIEVMFALGKTEGTAADLVRLDYLIRLNTAHLLQLMDMAKELDHVIKKHPSSKSESSSPLFVFKLYRGIKLHLMLHFPYYRSFYGMFNFLTDTQLLEQAHNLTHLAFQRTTKTLSSNLEEMAIWQGRRIHAERLSERAKHSLGQSHLSSRPIVTNTTEFVFSETTQFGKDRSDILHYDIASKLYMCGSGQPRGLHPFLKLEHLTEYLKVYVQDNPYSTGDIGTRMILRTQRVCAASKTTLELLYQINCSGNDKIPVSSFILYAQRDKVVGRGSRNSSSAQTKRKSRFSFFEVEYENEHGDFSKEYITVRLMAILKFSTVQFDGSRISNVHYMAFVLRMKQEQRLVNYGPYINLHHDTFGRNRSLALDIINFTAFHMPACVFQTPQMDDSLADLDKIDSAFRKENTFYQIPSSRIVSLAAVHSYSSLIGGSMSSEFLDKADLQAILDRYQEKNLFCDESEVEEAHLKRRSDNEKEEESDNSNEERDDASIETDSHCDSHEDF